MTTAKYVQPDCTTQDSATYKACLDAAAKVVSRIGGMFAPHAQDTPNMTILIDAGSFMYNQAIVSQAQQTTATITAPASNPRIDLIVINSTTGVIATITGAEAVSPVAPALTAGYAPIAEISLSVGQTSILNSNITDVRIAIGVNPPIDPAAATGGLRTLGTGSQQACAGNDSRLSDVRTPADTSVTEAKMASSAISQAKLKTSSGEVSIEVNSSGGNVTLPGGEYGFYPQVRSAASHVTAQIASVLSTTSYVTNIYLFAAAVDTLYARQRYVTSSGEVNWLFILRDKTTKTAKAKWFSCDHPCFGNGGDPDTVQHPFPDYNSATDEIVCIILSSELYNEIKGQQTTATSFLQVINESYEIDETATSIWPTEEVTVGLPEGYSWQNNSNAAPIKKVIAKPSYILLKNIKVK